MVFSLLSLAHYILNSHSLPWQVFRISDFYALNIDLAFIVSNSLKFFNGGWFPIGLSIVMVITMVIGHLRYGKQKLKVTLSEFNSKKVKE